jgi:GDPmannose 4,6-dehydratase
MAVACIHCNVEHPPVNENGQPLVEDGKLKLGNLDSVRDWGYAKEFVEAMWLMLQQDTPQDYVIGTNTAYTVRDLCKVAFDTVGLNWEDHVISDVAFMRPTEITASRGNYAKAKADLGWEPQTSFKELIELMVEADIQRISSSK